MWKTLALQRPCMWLAMYEVLMYTMPQEDVVVVVLVVLAFASNSRNGLL